MFVDFIFPRVTKSRGKTNQTLHLDPKKFHAEKSGKASRQDTRIAGSTVGSWTRPLVAQPCKSYKIQTHGSIETLACRFLGGPPEGGVLKYIRYASVRTKTNIYYGGWRNMLVKFNILTLGSKRTCFCTIVHQLPWIAQFLVECHHSNAKK